MTCLGLCKLYILW